MPEQFSKQFPLPGLDAPEATDRLFFAIRPDPATALRVARLAGQQLDEYGLKGRLLDTDHFHVTLLPLGDYVGLPAGLAATARDVASTIAAPAFDVVFDRAMSFSRMKRRQPLVLLGDEGVAALAAFQLTLAGAMQRTMPGGRTIGRYTPHMTMLYADRLVADHAVDAIGWTVRDFVLLHSLLGQNRHILLGQWPLAESTGASVV
jgi:2'-5' RNA ligase